MEIEADLLLEEISNEMNKIATAMLAGVETWEAYVRLVERASALQEFNETIREKIASKERNQ